MIIGLAVRVILEFLRRRGIPVPTLALAGRNMPLMQATGRATDALAQRASDYLDERRGPHGRREVPR